MSIRQQSTTRNGVIRSLFGMLLLLLFFGFQLTGSALAQESGVSDANSAAVSEAAPNLMAAIVAEDADWTPINVTLAVTETISVVSDPANGSTRITVGNKDVEYKPDPDYCNSPSGTATDDFTYTVVSTVPPSSVVNTVNMTVTCVNDAPVISAPVVTQNVNQNASLTFSAANGNLVTVSDVDAGGASLKLDLSVSNGTLTLASTAGLAPLTGNGTGTISATGSLTNLNAALSGLKYTPTTGYFGADSLAIAINDLGNVGSGGAKSDSAAVAISVKALPPTVNDDTAATGQNAPINIDVLTNDVANSGNMNPASVTVTVAAGNGSATPQISGAIRYTPTVNYNGGDSFTYRACNTAALCDTAIVNITVNALPPTVNDDPVETNEDTPINIDVLDNDVANSGSMDLNSVAVVGGSGPSHGGAIPLANGKIRYTPVANYNGGDSFTYRACNTPALLCDTAVVSIIVTPGNDGPTIEPIDDLVMIEGTTETVAVTVGDIDGDNLNVQAESDNTTLIPNANLTMSGTGNNRTLQIQAADNIIGRATITVSVSDGQSVMQTPFAVDVIAPDLSVSIDDGGVSVRPVNTVAYTIDYGNSSLVHTNKATGVYVEVAVPDHTQFDDAASDNGWSCTNGGLAGGVCRLNIGQLMRGESGTAIFAVNLSLAVPTDVVSVAVEAEIGDDGQNGNDNDLSNNHDGDTTPIDRSVLLLATKRDVLDVSGDNDGIAGPGDRVSYIIVIHNDSITVAIDAVFNDTPDNNTTLEVGSVVTTQGTITQGDNPGDNAVSVAIGEIAPNAVVTIEFSVIINTPVPEGVNQVANQGSISGENFPTVQSSDPDTPNVGDVTVTQLGEIPVLNAAKRAGLLIDANQDDLASPGDILNYTVTLSNRGVVNATKIFFNDTVDPNTKLINGTVMITDPGAAIISGNNDGDTGVAIDIGTLNSDEVVTITFAVQIDANLPDDVVQVANQGLIVSQEIPLLVTDNPDTPEPNDPTKTPVVIEPILVALKSYELTGDADNNDAPSPGDTIEYSINIRNDGTRASGIVFTDEFDSYTTLTRETSGQPYVQTSRGTVVSGNNAGDSTVVVTMDELGTGDSVSISFKVKIATIVPADLLFIENQGVVSSAEAKDMLTDDPKTPAKNDPTRTPITGSVSLDPTMIARMTNDKDGSGGYSEGDILNYEVTIYNSGNRAASKVVLEVPLDPRTEIFSNTHFPAPELPLALGTIPAGAERKIGIMVKLVNLGDNEEVPNQFMVTYYDPDADMSKTIPTNDPDTLAIDDPTVIDIQSATIDLYLPIVAASIE